MPPGVFFITTGAQGQPIHIARNIFISEALKRNAKHIFFLDSDIEMPHDGLVKLYQAKKPIIAGVYSQRAPPYGLSANINRQMLMPDFLDKYPDRVMDVHEVGAGALLIEMRVIERMARENKMQWYCMKPHGKELGLNLPKDMTSPKEIMVYTNDEAIQTEYRCKICNSTLIADFFKYTVGTGLSAQEGAFSEDYYWCYQARKCGFPVSIHCGVFCTHEVPNMKITREGLLNPVTTAMDI